MTRPRLVRIESMRGEAVAILLAAAVVLAARGTSGAEDGDPTYSLGDFWSYATNLTEGQGLAFEGTSRVEVVRFGEMPVQGSNASIAELLVRGGGSFSGTIPRIGTVAGSWSITGTEAWEITRWRSVRSFLRLTAEGELTGGPTPLPFALSLTNDTTRKTISDTGPSPVVEGGAGSWTAHWAGNQNITLGIEGVTSGWNASSFSGNHTIRFTHEGTERVTVRAGPFVTHVIREEGPGGFSRLRWYAPAAGNDVRQEEFSETGALIGSAELLQFRYAGEREFRIPWLLALNAVLVGIAAVLLVAVAIRVRRKAAEVSVQTEEARSGGPSP